MAESRQILETLSGGQLGQEAVVGTKQAANGGSGMRGSMDGPADNMQRHEGLCAARLGGIG